MITFSSLGLAPGILEAITELGFETPTPIQAQAIPAILSSDQDLIALAQTGTGKTASFGLPILQKIDPTNVRPQALILSPTRELAIQITKDLEGYGKFMPKLKSVAVYGGASIMGQIQSLRRGVHIVVATPGRALDLINRRNLDLSGIRFVVLDEADEMLNMGFQQDLTSILSETPKERQTLLFSATMASEVQRIARDYMVDPKEISVGARNSGSVNVTHDYYQVQARDRFEALKRIVAMQKDFYGIVFCRTRRESQELSRKLNQEGFPADALNGDLSQGQRDEVMDAFREKRITILVATDVAARGIDVNDLTHVVNFELPDDLESYIHRSGRTGRAGKNGISISIINKRESHKIKALERMSKQAFVKKLVPSGKELCEARLFSLIDDVVKEEADTKLLAPFMDSIHQKLDHLSKEELTLKLLSMEFHRLLTDYQNAPDLNTDHLPSNRRDERNESRGQVEFLPYEINLGMQQQVNPARLMGLINQELPMRLRFGKIEIHRQKSYFELEKYQGKALEDLMTGANFDGVHVVVRPSEPIVTTFERKKFNNKPSGKPGPRSGGYPKDDDSAKKRYPKRKRKEISN
ncbi:MAG: DEAD/DEAH box helicase [Bacteroidia bacterium]|nr:DEAD/DEAH box helicase [Bacteroidia bacterium]